MIITKELELGITVQDLSDKVQEIRALPEIHTHVTHVKEIKMALSKLEEIGLVNVKFQLGAFGTNAYNQYERIITNVGRESLVLACNDSDGVGGEAIVAAFEGSLSTFKAFQKVLTPPVK